MPDAFLSYADTAFVIDGMGRVADLSGYLTDEEKAQFVDSFLQEGDIDGKGSLKVFPVCKSTETLQILSLIHISPTRASWRRCARQAPSTWSWRATCAR